MIKLIATARHGAWRLFAAFLAVSALSAQQPPPPPQNLQVLPKDMPRQELIQTMRLFNQALGVQCDHCHVEREFAKDDKPAKLVARKMIAMVHETRNNSEKYLPEGAAAK